MADLRVGVIGLGVGRAHAAAYAEHPDCEVAVLCDASAERAREVQAEHPEARVTQHADEVLDDPEVQLVSIASYDSDHYGQVTRALEHGKHVFVEKPLCQTEEEAAEIRRLLRAHPGLRLSSNLPLRASPRFRAVKRWIDDGRFGRLYYLEGDYEYGRLWKITEGWRGDLEHYSVMLGGGIHMVDLLLWLTGGRAVRASGVGNRLVTEGTKFRFDDLVVGTLELEGGEICKVTANFGCVHPHYHAVKVFGTEATFVNGLGDGVLWSRVEGEPLPEAVTAEYPAAPKGALIPSFVEAVLGRGEPEVTEDQIFAALSACFAVDRAVASGETAEVRGL